MEIDYSYKRCRVRFYHGEWYEWGDGVWSSMTKDTDRDTMLRAQLYRDLSNKKVRKVRKDGTVDLVPYNPDKPKLMKVIDALIPHCLVEKTPPCWLNPEAPLCDPRNLVIFRNGILDLESYMAGTIRMIPTGLEFFNVTVAPYDFNSGAKCPGWLKFLGEIFQDDDERIRLLQEWFGYNMVSDSSMEKMMFLVGRPGSGKSTVVSTMRATVGPKNCGITTFKDLCSEFGLQPLVHKASIILPDAHIPTRGSAMQALERVKTIVGQDPVSVNRKFLTLLSGVQLPGRFTIVVNELPALPDSGRSLERRLLLIDFPETFEGREDWLLKDRLVKEAPGIAVWALEGLRRLRTQGQFTTATSSKATMEEFRQILSPVSQFLDECCIVRKNKDTWITKAQMFHSWCAWCKEQGRQPGNNLRLGRLLAQNPKIQATRKRLEGRQVTAYQNLQLTVEARDRYLVRG